METIGTVVVGVEYWAGVYGMAAMPLHAPCPVTIGPAAGPDEQTATA